MREREREIDQWEAILSYSTTASKLYNIPPCTIHFTKNADTKPDKCTLFKVAAIATYVMSALG